MAIEAIYAVKSYTNEWLLGGTKKHGCVRQIGETDGGRVVAYSKSSEGALKFIKEYYDVECHEYDLMSDKMVHKNKCKFPKRQLEFIRHENGDEIRRLRTLAICNVTTILGDCL